jgi:hypothetical protein
MILLLIYTKQVKCLDIGLILFTGFYHFFLSFLGRASESTIARVTKLVASTHTVQSVSPGTSVLAGLVPEPLLKALEEFGPDAFARKLFSESEGEFTWTKYHKRFLAKQADQVY